MSSGDNVSRPSSPGADASPAGRRSRTQQLDRGLRSVRKSASPAARTWAGFWRDYEWWVVGLAAVAALVLGVAGFLQQGPPSPTPSTTGSSSSSSMSPRPTLAREVVGVGMVTWF
jgi:hypothetical protein